MELPLLQDIAIILGTSIVALFVSHKINVPSILAYLFTGILVGPYGFGLIHAIVEVEHLAEIGVILLLFAIGLEFSFSKLAAIQRWVLLGGGMQVGLTILGVYGVMRYFGSSNPSAIFTGFLLSLSSTAIVLKLLQERGEMETTQGQATLALLIFQDIIIVPMMLATPIMAGTATNLQHEITTIILKTGGILILVIFGARKFFPWVLHHIAMTKSRELFLMTICATGLAIAWLTNWAGLSLGLGAFLAGLIISDSEYSHHALSSILPFRDVFTSFFFVSIGMLLNVGFLMDNLILILGLTLFVLTFKSFFTFIACEMLGLPLKNSSMVAFNLAQIGEFSFILSKVGLTHNLISPDHYQTFLAVSVLTLGVTPLLMVLSHPASHRLAKLPFSSILRGGMANKEVTLGNQTQTELNDHLVIFGYGITGQMLAKAAKYAQTPYVILEMNPHTVRKYRAEGEPIYYGDATYEESLEIISIKSARISVVALPDIRTTQSVVQMVRELNPKIYIIARTRFMKHIEQLYYAGADEVIPAEYETAVEIFARVMANFLIPQEETQSMISEIRKDDYQMFRGMPQQKTSVNLDAYLNDLEIKVVRVQEQSLILGKTLKESDMRREFGVNLLALRRGTETITNPRAEEKFLELDLCILMGTPQNIHTILPLFQKTES